MVSFDRCISLRVAVCISVFSMFACGQHQAPTQQWALLIEKIQSARAIDSGNLSDGHTDMIQAADSVYQAHKAQRVIGRLKRGEAACQLEIDDALDVPPESIPADARSEFIRELMTAEKRDELGETHGPGNVWLA